MVGILLHRERFSWAGLPIGEYGGIVALQETLWGFYIVLVCMFLVFSLVSIWF
jgi:hypothetical protein